MRNALRSDELQSVVGSTLKPDEIRMKWFMNLIDYQDARPIYEQICDGYKALILKKVMLPNDPMPSVRSLAVDLSTNPNTVQRAFSELERQGFIYTVKGKGSFVNGDASLRENKKKELVSRLVLWMKEAGELGFDADQLYQAALDMKTGSSGGMVQ